MQITTYQSATDFLARTRTMLEAHEAANNLMLGLVETLIHTPDRYQDWSLFTVDDKSAINVTSIVAVQTPPFNLIIHVENPDPRAMVLLARYCHEEGIVLPGVTGRIEPAQSFANAWTDITGRKWRIGMHLRVYELRQVIPPVGIDGRFVQAGAEHKALSRAWAYAFQNETLDGSATVEQANQIAERHIEHGSLYLWCVGNQPVSMAARTRKTAHGEVVSLVYTPPEQRGHGYASAVVAELSQTILDSGKAFCALFTDLSNPISNRIYQKIGYRPLEDFDDLKFDP
jgi:predicted GNAT family acetyltransferase